jgi:N6-adenosine-specific RNA methylase IME4
MAEDRYKTIVADPPWDHSDGTGYVVTIGRTTGDPRTTTRRLQRTDGGYITGLPYGTTSLEAIKALPVRELAADDAHLYLWTTNRYLRDVWDVAEAWGFKGVCIITWCKAPTGVMPGGAWGSNVEFCLFARRGNLSTVGKAKGRWYSWPRQRGPWAKKGGRRQSGHSAKPEAFLDLVEQVSPGPYLELFSRRCRLGWDYRWHDGDPAPVAA